MTTKEKIAVMQAYSDGKPVEFTEAGPMGYWRRLAETNPTWNWSGFRYRIALDPLDEIAPGHNPARLTVRQVGEGWRLLEKEEIVERAAFTTDAQIWLSHGWCCHSVNLDAPSNPYRTQRPPGYFLPKPEPIPIERLRELCGGREPSSICWSTSDLPDGMRPMYVGEFPVDGDEYEDSAKEWRLQFGQQMKMPALKGACRQRTRRPAPPLEPARYTVEQIADYIAGWTIAPAHKVAEIGEATLHNALNHLRDKQDGIAAVVARKWAK